MNRSPKQKWLLILVVVLLISNIVTLSIYWLKDNKGGRYNKPTTERGRMGQFMVNEMKFSKEQEVVYWSLRDTMISKQKGVMDSIRIAKRQFFDLLKQQDTPAFDSLLNAHTDHIAGLQKQLDLITFHHFQKVKAICTPEQLQKFDTVISEIVNRMASFRRPGPDRSDSTFNRQERK